MPGRLVAGRYRYRVADRDLVLADLKTRGVRDILIACVDGLSGFPDAIEAIFPMTTVRTCLVHYADQAQLELEAFDEKWGQRFPVITRAD
jgi:transposase-like protein